MYTKYISTCKKIKGMLYLYCEYSQQNIPLFIQAIVKHHFTIVFFYAITLLEGYIVMSVDKNWTFYDLVDNIKSLKEEYIFYLALFSFSEDIESKRLQNNYIRSIRDLFYSINLDDRKIDIAWEYMNDYVSYFDLIHYLHQLDKHKKK